MVSFFEIFSKYINAGQQVHVLLDIKVPRDDHAWERPVAVSVSGVLHRQHLVRGPRSVICICTPLRPLFYHYCNRVCFECWL